MSAALVFLLGRQDSNLRIADPKSAALPLGDSPRLVALYHRRGMRGKGRQRRHCHVIRRPAGAHYNGGLFSAGASIFGHVASL